MSLVNELQRRNVFRVVAAYLVVGWLLTEVLTTILPTFGAPDWASKAVIYIFALGFIPAVVLSWIYELTPEGIKREADLDRDGDDPHTDHRKLNLVTVSVVVIAIILVALFSARETAENASPDQLQVSNESVAVLPFVNMSKDEDNEYFSDGLTETLLHMLAQVPDLKVAARTSSFAFKGKNLDIRQIAEALQVSHVLEGSVQQVEGRVRITAQLIRAADGYHVWSESYDRTMDDIFAIQDEIAMKVGGALSVSLLGPAGGRTVDGVGTENLDAYDMYLQALRETATFSYGGLQASEQLLKGALAIDPEFLDAKTALASNFLHQLETGLMDRDEALDSALAMTDQVLDVDPQNIGSRSIQLFAITARFTGETGAEEMFRSITELEAIVAENPDAYHTRILLSRLLEGLQQFDRALQLHLDALQRDPFNPRIHYEIGARYLDLGQLDEARSALRKSLEIEPMQPNSYLRLSIAAARSGDGVDVLRELLHAMDVDPRDHEIPGFIAAFLYELGLIDEGDDFRKRVDAVAPTSEVAYRIALLRAINSGDEDASIAVARRAIEADINERQFSYGGAVQYLLRRAAANGTVAEESAYLEKHAPGILNIDAATIPEKYRIAQFVAFDAWYTILARDELVRRIERIREVAATFGLDPLSNPATKVSVYAMTGKTSEAIELALTDVFTQPVTVNMNWKQEYEQAQYVDFIADERVQAALKKRADDMDALRESVRDFLNELSRST